MTAWLHGSHLTDNKLLDDSINDVTVNIGKDKDWSISDYSEFRKTTIDGKEYIQQTTNLFYAQGDDSGNGTKSLKIPLQKMERNILLMIYRKNKERWFWQWLTL